MSAYLDTSVLAAYYLPEARSGRAENALRRLTWPAISAVVELELVSVVARRVRTRELDAPGARHALAGFGADRAAGLYRFLAVHHSHFARARAWMETFATSLRTLDALHLALAHQESLPVLTADAKLARAARQLGVPVRFIR